MSCNQDFKEVVLRPSSLKKKTPTQHYEVTKQLKIENDTENLSHEHVGKKLGKKMQDARLAMGIKTQKELAKKLNIKPEIYNTYESGKAIPDNVILQKIRKVLKIKL